MAFHYLARPGPAFRCHVYRDFAVGGVLLEPVGDLDLATAPIVERALRAVEARHPALIVVYLRSLTFMDTAGLHMLLGADERRRESGVRLVIVRGTNQITKLFEVTGADRHLPLVDRMPTGRWMAAPNAEHVFPVQDRRPAQDTSFASTV